MHSASGIYGTLRCTRQSAAEWPGKLTHSGATFIARVIEGGGGEAVDAVSSPGCASVVHVEGLEHQIVQSEAPHEGAGSHEQCESDLELSIAAAVLERLLVVHSCS